MSRYSKLIFGLFFLLFSSLITVVLSAPMIAPTTETHYYSYSVREDGSANIWLRIDELLMTTKEREYSLVLPSGALDEAKAWYRENNLGCIYPMEVNNDGGTPSIEPGLRYDQMYPCKEEPNEWQALEVKKIGNKLNIVIPKLKVTNNLARQNQTMSLGVSYKMANVTNKRWWGREIKIETAKSENYISYESVGVDLPGGVYLRDKQSGPANWGEMMNSKTVMSIDSRGIGDMDDQAFNPLIFDSAGGGQIVKDKSNIPPGENFTFSLMSATSIWKLYTKEIGFILGAVFVLILVASALLRLIIGRKPIWWYMAIMLLVAIFFIIIIWLFTVYKSLFYGYPAPFTNFNEGVDITAPAVEILPL